MQNQQQVKTLSGDPPTIAISAVNSDITPTTTSLYNLGTSLLRFLGIYGNTLDLSATSNQITMGTTRTATINAPTPAGASRIYTIPDPGAAASFVMTEVAQTINGVKTFSGANIHSGINTFSNTTDSTSTGTGAIVTSGGLGVAKTAYFGTGVFLPTTGGTASVLDYNEKTSFSTAFTQGGVSTASLTVYVERKGARVTIAIPNMTINSPAAGATIVNNTAIPARFRPTNDCQFNCNTYDGAAYVVGLAVVSTAGIITIYKDAANVAATFTNGVNTGILYYAHLTWTIY